MTKKFKILLMFLVFATMFTSLPVNASTISIAEYAKRYEGTGYKFGGNTPEEGFDCSGFILFVFDKYGKKLPRTSEGQYEYGVSVEKADLQPGDLVFFKDTYKQGISHTGIYLGDNSFISAENEKRGVAVARLFGHPYWDAHYVGAKRLIAINETPTVPTQPQKSFIDVSTQHPAHEAIITLSGQGVINGFPNDEFKPEETITRGQAAAILNRVLKLVPKKDITFSDIDKNHQFAVHIAAMNEADILKGYENGSFGLNDKLTRTQLAVIVDRAFKLQMKAGGEVHIASYYEDIPPTYWAKDSINALKHFDKTGIFQTSTYEFTKIVTRADFTAAVYSAIDAK